ncbi:hypothetical protein [Microbacterium sp. JB110]|uniref:hypothetical protein n=1 Tax=Microbacterium sp. JB110 TaxID=2024477 RepID=UPI0015F11BE8|nr:hypothetical protein [Microbacterium sp. JB110]
MVEAEADLLAASLRWRLLASRRSVEARTARYSACDIVARSGAFGSSWTSGAHVVDLA